MASNTTIINQPFEISVELGYESLPSIEKKGLVLRSKCKPKNKKKFIEKSNKTKSNKTNKTQSSKSKSNKSNKSSKSKNKRKRGKKKKIAVVEVTSNIDELLEDQDELDNEYQEIKERILTRYKKEDKEVQQFNLAMKLEEKIEDIINLGTDTFYLVDITTIILKYKYFRKYLPRVTPFYAVKCNPDPYLISALIECGTGLDVASMQEMKKGLNANLSSDKMIFANPCKMPEHIRFAAENNVSKMTFDNKTELEKIHKYFPTAQLVLRILADDSHSTMRFGSKFGADINTEVEGLLSHAYELNLTVIGVSFHVGSGCQSGIAYSNSLVLAKKVFTMAENMGHPMNFLDIGGGFLGMDTDTVKFSEIATSISKSLDELFDPSVQIIAEPGRYFASECAVLITTVIAKREREYTDPETNEKSNYIDYYISDGVYGSFNNMFFDYFNPTPVILNKKSHESNSESSNTSPKEDKRSTLFGPTCDSIDVICKDVELPQLEISDTVYFFNMGAYTSAAASSFNGFNPPKSYYMIS